jgi:L-ascorbate metabolism protein UlaG (beta-lactamase superfamily)
MIKSLRKNRELVADILLHENSDYLHGWWLGQSGYLLQYKGKRVLIDPYLSNSLTQKYDQTNKPHVRISELVIEAGMLPRIDLITSSHNHTDHLDAETILPVLTNNPACQLIIPEANRAFVASRLGTPLTWPVGLNDGQAFSNDWISITAIPAAHNTLDRTEEGLYPYLGYIIKMGGVTLYHSGDTLLYDGMELFIKAHQPDIAFLPINGNDPSRKVAGNLDADEAIGLAKACDIPLVIPCHYDLFAFNTADVNHFISKAKLAKQNYCVLDLGGKFSSRELQP